MKKSASATLLGERIFINSKKGTQSVAVFSKPLFELHLSDNPILIGEKVRICIESFQPGSERLRREDWRTINDPLIKLSKERSKKAFWTKIKSVSIVLIDDILYFVPKINKGMKDGFKKTIHPDIELEYTKTSDNELGLSLLKAFELSSIEIN
jgi:hypothetical protein